MRDRWTKLAVLTMAMCLAAGCSSSGLDFPDVGDLNPFDDSCTTCEPPAPEPCAPEPACAPAPAPEPACAPAPQAVASAPARPVNANPGEVWCYVRVPAVTNTVTEQVCVQPETNRQVWVPEETKQVTEQVCVREAQTRNIPIPAEYKDVTEQVCVAPGKTEWRRVDCTAKTSLRAQEQLGECWTLADVPPQYETRTKQVCVRPAETRCETIPAEYETRTKTVVVRPGYYKAVPVPPVYETRSKEVVVSQPRWEWRRTSECEVPGVAGAAPAPAAVMDPIAPTPAPGAGDDGLAPPTGALPALDPLR